MTDVDIDELREQEWTVSDAGKQTVEEYEFVDGTTMEFLIQDPDTDAILEYVAIDPSANEDQKLYQLVSGSVVAPEVTLERWRDLRTVDKIGLGELVSEAIGLNDLMDFSEVGLDQIEED